MQIHLTYRNSSRNVKRRVLHNLAFAMYYITRAKNGSRIRELIIEARGKGSSVDIVQPFLIISVAVLLLHNPSYSICLWGSNTPSCQFGKWEKAQWLPHIQNFLLTFAKLTGLALVVSCHSLSYLSESPQAGFPNSFCYVTSQIGFCHQQCPQSVWDSCHTRWSVSGAQPSRNRLLRRYSRNSRYPWG